MYVRVQKKAFIYFLMGNERLHELKKSLFSAPISVPYVVNRSVLALKTGHF